MNQLVTLQEACQWATEYLDRNVSLSNVSYLVQYGKVKKHGNNGKTLINLKDLKDYYASYLGQRELKWKKKIGNDVNWTLSFDHLREKDTTKHVHRLHPYKGKFIPQLVEYFIDSHVDDFKKNIYFKPGDIILDPFSGSGTTLVQANEMGMHSIGVDISSFNCMIAQVKLSDYNFLSLEEEIREINKKINNLETDNKISSFEQELLKKLA